MAVDPDGPPLYIRHADRADQRSAGGLVPSDATSGARMSSVYNVIELIGTSTDSWEQAANNAIKEAAMTLRDLRVAEVVEQDVVIENGAISLFRTKVRLSFKHETAD
jgi:hypothetical protein